MVCEWKWKSEKLARTKSMLLTVDGATEATDNRPDPCKEQGWGTFALALHMMKDHSGDL